MKPRPTLYILDAYSLIYQVFHAIPLMTGPAGQPTQAVFGIFRDLVNLVRDRKPDYLAAAFDGAGRVFRSDLYPEYKAQRPAMPEELVPQIPVIRRVFDGFRVPVLMEAGAEADDVIATVCRRAEEQGLDVVICTADKDARQLLNDHVRIFNLRTQKFLDVAGLKGDWGIRPDQVVDLLSLTGDTADNVPGIPGIGLKTGAKLLEEFNDLENLLAHVDQVSGAKRKENLRQFAETARLARSLIVLREDLPLELDWESLKTTAPDTKQLKTLCIESGFHRFLTELPEDEKLPEAVWQTDYRTIDTPELLREFVAELAQQPRFCLDTETTAIDPLRADLVGLAFSWNEGVAYYLPVRGPMWDKHLDVTTTLEALRPILASDSSEKIGQNLKYDMLVLSRYGIEIGGPISDTMVLSYLLESGERNHNLDQLAHRFLDHTMVPISDLIGKGKTQKTMDQVEVARVAHYAGEDADATWRLEAILAAKVRDEGLWPLYDELERPLITILAKMETAGIKVDVPLLSRLSKEFGGRLSTIEEEIYAQAGHPFNIGSGPQLRQVLFEELKLPSLQKTPGGEPSTAQEVLEELAAKHPLPRLLIQHRQLAKLKSTYLDSLPGLVHPGDGRVHASFNQGVTATGRLSSSDPNLQNIPVRTEDGRQIRQAFVAGTEGWSLLTADYSQIELRILAHFSGDPALRQAFAADQDIHSVVAARIFGVAESAVDSSMRRVAKTVNFGVLYGLSPYGLAGRLGISQVDANAFIEAYFQEYEGVDTFITRTLETALATGRVETILGRRRPINGIKNTTGHNRNLAERTAVNTVIQGSAADLIKRAMLTVDHQLRNQGLQARMLLQIHDELIFEAPDEEIAALAPLVRDAMATALKLDVPLKVDLAAGPNWLDVQPVS
ncbi:DNA polymerase I [Singulisphaera sp. GP187]|uniref:DNA polymerase I n=1 Tax=Singulisphaera sp. GP187 TaxID=1882752 RepID=UPI00092A485F|nr:DNA polymerase I [Singulisphaera sp. GP187]SIN86494.1 DNA polymerase I [Singulisphaera sp. GP187]